MRTVSLVMCALLPLCVSGYVKTSWKDLAANPGYSFEDYVAEYSKKYATTEELALRRAIFEVNLDTIRRHNADNTATYKMGLNEYADLTNEEFKRAKVGKISGIDMIEPSFAAGTKKANALPDSVDWRKKGVVTPVKNQAGCGSCWAFSATETLESAAAIATGKLVTLGPQQLVSCAPNPNQCGGTGGCQGSTQPLAFNYTETAGLTAEKDYPYTSGDGISGHCKPEKIHPAVGCKGYTVLPMNDYDALMDAVANVGPIAISADAGAWQLYESGVFSKHCGFAVDHGIQLVGYGVDGSQMYWLVRNSWGASWGEEGYIRIVRNGANNEPCGVDKNPADGVACKNQTQPLTYCGECAILSSSSYPTGAFVYNN